MSSCTIVDRLIHDCYYVLKKLFDMYFGVICVVPVYMLQHF